MKMPFGSHKNKDIEDVPSDYLHWVSENVDNERLVIAANEELDFRELTNTHFYDD